MIIVFKPGTGRDQVESLVQQLSAAGCKPLYLPGDERLAIGAIGDERLLASLRLENHPQVESVSLVPSAHKLVSREFHPHDTIVNLGEVPVGSNRFVVIAGPCAVENREQMTQSAELVQRAGGSCLRGGAFKPRSSPYAFQGLGVEGLKLLAEAARSVGLPCVTEVVETADIEVIARYADAFQVGARNMQNFALLKALGQQRKPVLLKRGMAAELKDMLLAAEYIVSEGNGAVILCERGIRTFETATRNTLDLSAVPYLKQRSHLPVVVDPSHGTGRRELVAPMARAAAACGADGIIVETHPDPSQALSDGAQSLYPQQFRELMVGLRAIVAAVGRTL